MTSVCFVSEDKRWQQDQWSWVFSNFCVDECWQIDDGEVSSAIYQNPTTILTAADLPTGRPLVVLSAQDARYVQGDEPLHDFVHPEDAIYFFGKSFGTISDDVLGGRVPDHKVYISNHQYEMFAFAAGYVTLYDRFVKRGCNFG